jgi:release factor glutamine methyltransferase
MPPLSPATPPPLPPSRFPPATRAAVTAALRAAGCVFAEEEADLLLTAAGTPDGLTALLDRRVAGEPLELVLGWAEFHGLRVVVEPGVFVPRRRTEFLVDRALALAPDVSVVVDLCCGSGAVGAALAAALGSVELHSADIDPAAVRCARRNVAAAGGRVHLGDLYEALPGELRGRVGILAANVPYVPSGEVGLLPAEAREHEPLIALDGGGDGLDVLRRVAAEAPGWLAPDGCLLVETSERQSAQALAVLTAAGLDAALTVSEDLGATVVAGIGRRRT